MEEIVNYLQAQPWWAIVTSIIALFSAVTAVVPTPKQGSKLAKVYKVIDFIALNIGYAKDKGPKQ
tara:strand:- start:1674 stop:1868 length:195 start_codon:yes stop_codon:yes gene_type:complete